MSSSVLILRVFWKEYRQQRAFWLALALCAVLIQIAVVTAYVLDGRPAPSELIFGMAMAFPCLFALGCGATLFAGEHEAETFGMLQALPVSARQVFYGKLACAVVGQLTLPLVLLLSATLLIRETPPETERVDFRAILNSLMMSVEFLAWGMFFSLRGRRPLWAVVNAAAMAMLIGFVGLPFLALILFDHEPGLTINLFWTALPVRGLVALAVLALDYWFAIAWLDEKPRTLLPSLAWRRTRRPAERASAEVFGPRARALGRLIWHEWRQSRGLAIGTLGLSIVCILPSLGISSELFRSSLTLPLAMLAAILGGCSFLSDRSQHGYSFFAERGIDARRVWLSRHMVWGGLLSLFILICTMFIPTRPVPGSILEVLGYTLVAYAAAQVGSLYVSSCLIGLLLGLFLAFAACLWGAMMDAARAPLIWTVAPLPFLLLWITWLRAPAWITEQTSRRVQIRSAMSSVLPIALVVGVAIFRVYEIPQVTLPPRDDVLRPATDEERTTAQMYEEAIRLLPQNESLPGAAMDAGTASAVPIKKTPDQVAPEESTAKPSSATRADYAPAVAKFLEASRRPACRFQFRPGEILTRYYNLFDAVLSHESPSKELDEPLERYFAVLRFARHLYQSDVSPDLGDGAEAAAFYWIVQWGGQDGRTADEIQRVIDRLDRECFFYKPPRDRAVLYNHVVAQKLIPDDPTTAQGRALRNYRTLVVYMPWERLRLHRLLAYSTAELLAGLRAAEFDMQSQKPFGFSQPNTSGKMGRLIASSLPVPTVFGDFSPATEHQLKITTIGGLVGHETRRRAARIRLELLHWRAEHGALPERLDQLAAEGGAYRLPPDPFTGRPFLYRPAGAEFTLNDWKLPRHAPFLWSAGLRVVDLRSGVDNREVDISSYMHRPKGPFGDPAEAASVRSLQALWEWGWVFPILAPTDAP